MRRLSLASLLFLVWGCGGVVEEHPTESEARSESTLASCPDQLPQQDSACSGDLSCQYEGQDECGHELDPHAFCENGQWTVGVNAVLCLADMCPDEVPLHGSPCAIAFSEPIECDYTKLEIDDCGRPVGPLATCDNGSWTLWRDDTACLLGGG